MRRNSKDFLSPTLFDLPVVPSRVEDVMWSYSRRSVLEICPRKYFLDYYGGNRFTALTEVVKDELLVLKEVQNRYQRTGELLHLAIAQYLRGLHKGDVPNEAGLARWIQHLFRADRDYSASYPNDDNGSHGREHAPKLLHEVIYRVRDAETLSDEAEQRMLDAFHACVTDPQYGAFRLGSTNPAALIERRFTLTGLPCRVGGMVDLAYPAGERIVIVDWKSGADAGSGADSLQLAVYALWAIDHFGCDAASIDVYKAHLSSREIVSFRVDQRILAAARARIVQDAMTMATLDHYGVEGIAEAFTPCPYPSVCRLCPFARMCPVGREVLDA